MTVKTGSGCLIIYICIYKFEFIQIQTFSVHIMRRILSDFQRNPKPKLIENITNNIHD